MNIHHRFTKPDSHYCRTCWSLWFSPRQSFMGNLVPSWGSTDRSKCHMPLLTPTKVLQKISSSTSSVIICQKQKKIYNNNNNNVSNAEQRPRKKNKNTDLSEHSTKPWREQLDCLAEDAKGSKYLLQDGGWNGVTDSWRSAMVSPWGNWLLDFHSSATRCYLWSTIII